MESKGNFYCGDHVLLYDEEGNIEVYRIEAILYKEKSFYNITLIYENRYPKSDNGLLVRHTGINSLNGFNCDYPVLSLNKNSILVSQKLLQLLYD